MWLKQSALIYKWICVILTVSAVHSCFILYENLVQHLKAAGQLCWWICSLWLEKCCTRAQCHYTRLSSVFTFIESHADDTRLLQSNHTPVQPSDWSVINHYSACLCGRLQVSIIIASFPTFFLLKVTFHVLFLTCIAVQILLCHQLLNSDHFQWEIQENSNWDAVSSMSSH